MKQRIFECRSALHSTRHEEHHAVHGMTFPQGVASGHSLRTKPGVYCPAGCIVPVSTVGAGRALRRGFPLATPGAHATRDAIGSPAMMTLAVRGTPFLEARFAPRPARRWRGETA